MPWLCHTWKGQLMLLYCKPQSLLGVKKIPSADVTVQYLAGQSTWQRCHLYLTEEWSAQNEVLSWVEEFKYLGVCSRVKAEWSRRLTDRLVQSWQWCGCYTSLLWWKESWENQSIWRLMWPYRPIWSGALCSDWKNKITDASICDEFPMKGVCVQP